MRFITIGTLVVIAVLVTEAFSAASGNVHKYFILLLLLLLFIISITQFDFNNIFSMLKKG